MKKLMVCAAVAMAAFAVNAAAVTWNTGTLYVPNGDGSWSTAGTKASASNPGTWAATVAFYTMNSETGSLESFVPSGTGKLSVSGISAMGNMSSKVGNSGSNVFANKAEYYMSMTITYTTDAGVYSWEMDPTKFTTKDTGDSSLSVQLTALWSDGSKQFMPDDDYTFTPVPEPTSAMLLLLGMAGLALRRRRA